MFAAAIQSFFQAFGLGIVACGVFYAALMFLSGQMRLGLGISILVGAVLMGGWQIFAAQLMGFANSAGFG